MTKGFLAYSAGFIDGEGCFSISILRPTPNNRRKYTFYVYALTVVNTDQAVLEEFCNFFKGKISKRKELPNRRTCYQWILHGNNLVDLCHKLIPYLRVKKEQALNILEYSKTIDGRRHSISTETKALREILYNRMKKLNHGIKE